MPATVKVNPWPVPNDWYSLALLASTRVERVAAVGGGGGYVTTALIYIPHQK